MEPFALQFSDDDLRRFAAAIEKLPKPVPPATAVDAARYERGKVLAAASRCANCHNRDFAGAGSNPRLAHQREDYLLKALRDYKSAARIDQGALMASSVKDLADAQLVDLAHYLANVR
jgi:cytochrome c553